MKTRPESVRKNTSQNSPSQGENTPILGQIATVMGLNNDEKKTLGKSPGKISESLGNEAKATLDDLQIAINKSASFLMMTCESLSVSITSFLPKEKPNFPQWPKFIELNINGGIADLVADQVSRLRDAFTDWRSEQLSIITGAGSHELKTDLESEVYCLNALADYLGKILSTYYYDKDLCTGPMLLSWRLSKPLNEALAKSLTLRSQLLDAIETPEPSQRAA
jgi:hypothetical protein